MTLFDLDPVYRSHSRYKRRYLIIDDNESYILEAYEYGIRLAEKGIPFVVRKSDSVISGTKWLTSNVKQ